MRFRRIYLAAPVLPKNFDWKQVIENRQVGHWADAGRWVIGDIHSDRGRRDVPVGWLCSLLHGLGSKDIGTSGLDGFDGSHPALKEHRYPGGHGHMLAPRASPTEREAAMQRRLGEVASFIQEGAEHDAPQTQQARLFSFFSRILGTAARPWALVLLASVIVAANSGVPQPAVVVGVFIYATLILIGQF